MSFINISTGEFAAELASPAPVPGGGGASALCGALGAALASMVGNLTVGKKKYAQYESDLQRILAHAEKLRQSLLELIDEDAECFKPLSHAYSIPKDDPEYDTIMESALRLACSAPMNIMRTAAEAIELHSELEQKGSRLMQSDVGVGVLCCKTALMGASLNVYINVSSMKDEEYAAKLRSEADGLLAKYCPLADEIYAAVSAKLL